MQKKTLRGGVDTTRKILNSLEPSDVNALAEELQVKPERMKEWHAALTSTDSKVTAETTNVILSIALVELMKRTPRLRVKVSDVAI